MSRLRSVGMLRIQALAVACALLLVVVAASTAGPTGALPSGGPGSAGTDTAIPDTESATTVSGRGPFEGLQVKVNQTRNLVNQAVSLSWTGAAPTYTSDRYIENYLQVFQCWGEDDGTVPSNPGPPPEQCVGGATTGAYGVSSLSHANNTFAVTRIIGANSWPGYDPGLGVTDPKSGLVFRPFRAVDGTEVGVPFDVDFNPALGGGNYWLNPYFDITTTNELAGARTRPDGTGTELMEVVTGVESSGLGCGQRLQRASGEYFTPKCWLVVVPRGTREAENAGTPLDASPNGVMTSPFAPAAWANRIAVPLEFNSVDSACALGAKERRMVGTELVLPAIASWQPALCATPGLPPYSYANVSDAAARQQLLAPTAGSAGMILVQKPLDPELVGPSNPAVYAPVALSGLVIGFNVERIPEVNQGQAVQDLAGVRIQNLNLTPRLVAKLLTQSYRSQVEVGSTQPPQPQYAWELGNPANLAFDEDFLQFNPEFRLLTVAQGRNFSGLLFPGANSDVAEQVWRWILEDPEAKAWLDGQPDPWGMKVNPLYSTSASLNPNGLPFGDPTPVNFPKADPYCRVLPPGALTAVENPPPLCGTDWVPYSSSFREAGRSARAADDRSKVNLNQNAVSPDQVWTRTGPQLLGQRAMLALTDSPSAELYGLQSARLSRAGDNGPDRTFVAPNTDGLTRALAGMRPAADPTVLEPDPQADAPGGYPLATLTYAATRPLSLDTKARSEYAAFIDYAAGNGQVPGLEPGQLPRGFAAMPSELTAQAEEAAQRIRDLQPPVEEPAPTQRGDSGSSGSPTGLSSPPAPTPASGPRASSPTTVAPAAASPSEQAATAPSADAADSGGSGLLTPIVALARNRYLLPAVAVVALLSALGALEVTKRPRRAASPPKGDS